MDDKSRGALGPESAPETQEVVIGEHVVLIEPDIVLLRFRGDYEVHDQRRVSALLNQVFEERGAHYVLGDISALGRMSFEARRASAESVRRSTVAAAAVIGASHHLRVIVTLGQRATVLLGAKPYPLQFMQSEEEARAWLRAERLKAK